MKKCDSSVVGVHAEHALTPEQNLYAARRAMLPFHTHAHPLRLLERDALRRSGLQCSLHLLHVDDVVVGPCLCDATSSLPQDHLPVAACSQGRRCVQEVDEVDEGTTVHELHRGKTMDGERAQGSKGAEDGRQTVLVLVVHVADEDGKVWNGLPLDGDRQAAAVHGRRRTPPFPCMEAKMVDVNPEHMLCEMRAIGVLEV